MDHFSMQKEKMPNKDGQERVESYFSSSSSVPAWNSLAQGNQQHAKLVSKVMDHSSANAVNKGLVNQLAPEEFSVADVVFLQKLTRELHVENMQKTMANLKLENAYHNLEDEISALKRDDEKRRGESNVLLKIALQEISHHQKNSSQGDKVFQQPKNSDSKPLDESERDELNKLREMCTTMKLEEVKLRRHVKLYTEKYDYFQTVAKNSGIVSEQLKSTVKFLEMEVEAWKERCRELQQDRYYQTGAASAIPMHQQFPAKPKLYLIPEKSDTFKRSSITAESIGTEPIESRRTRQLDLAFVNQAVGKYLTPKDAQLERSHKMT